MTQPDTRRHREPTSPVRSHCPECKGRLSVLRVFGGSKASEYWTLQCNRCHSIHLDIVASASQRAQA
jgi:Zn finger protein HypA/HybF involved in hydrogenase expression